MLEKPMVPMRVDHGDCPYLPNRRWVADIVPAEYYTEEEYELLLERGVRRSGSHLYRNACPGCDLCIPLRVSTARFSASKTQRRVLRSNSDVTIHCMRLDEHNKNEGNADVLALYDRYHRTWHGHEDPVTPDDYDEFLGKSPFEGALMRYWKGNRLIGAGWLDILPDGVSSVYFAFDPDYADRRLGTFSILKEIEWTRSLGKPWLYLGFWVPGGRSMEYKAAFRPHQLATGQRWRDAGEIVWHPDGTPHSAR